METVYPNDDEIKFRKQHFGVEDILKGKVECTICLDDLLNEIILKKTVMVHQSHLFLCCHNCFYKLCDGHKFSCILCTSNKDLSICVKCNFNVCNRCVENHKIDTVSNSVLNKCFACVPQMLWKQRAQAANVLKVFCSQLCMPNGLLVNETEHEQAVQKYLLKEAKIEQNSSIDTVKNNLCIDFIVKSYKLSIINKLSEISSDDTIPIDEHLNKFFNIFEHILQETCSTITHLKSIFNISSHLSHKVSAMMKLSCLDENESVLLSNSRITKNVNEVMKKNPNNHSLNKSNILTTTRILRSQNKQKNYTDNLNSTISLSSSVQPSSKVINKKLTIVKKRLNNSNTSSLIDNKSANEVHTDLVKDDLVQTKQLFDDDDEIESTRKLRNNKEIPELTDIHSNTACVTRSRSHSSFNISSVSDDDNDSNSDYKGTQKMKGKKRKLLSSNSSKDSDSSSKSFKKTLKRKYKNNINKTSIFDLTTSDSSSSSEKCSSGFKNHRIIRQLSNEESDEVSDSDSSDASLDHHIPKTGRKNIRRLIPQAELGEVTKSALKEEELRKKRIEKRQKQYNTMCNLPRQIESCKKLVLDFDDTTMEELVTVHPDLVKFLKPHQVKGITFLWNSVFESLARMKDHKGNGSILAHCMGLGKTLQIIALVHTLFRYPETGIKTILIITPNSTVENWLKEFHKWLHGIDEKQKFFVLNLTESKTYEGRKNIIDEWQREYGVLITSYELYRSVVNYKHIDNFPSILKGLVDPGPDLIICDEGHVIKNHITSVSKSINRIKTLRRIVLTGTPLQNNLREYHCMVDFIRPNLLGSIRDFTNRFINPITNGQYSDSTPLDVELMKGRSHVLHRMLEGFVQRFDYNVLTPFLPPKHEYVIYLKMSDKQIELYQKYLDSYRQPDLFTNYNMLQIVWTHPKLLEVYSKRTESKREKEKFKDNSFIDSYSNSAVKGVENRRVPVLDSTSSRKPDTYLKWWKPYVSKTDLESVYPYSKFIMMFSILRECESIGDKVLLFSQSLYTLDLIQDFLVNAEDKANDIGGPYGKSWDHGADFYRIDGSVNLKDREDYCERFNDVNNTRMRLLLLSTKAFNLGINLVGANRVIIFDVTWNPSLNVQSIFRVFRFGQIKPCYIYRLISEGTMEQKIYERQISKLSMAFRVVDEHQIDRHFNAKCQEELYEFEPNTNNPKSTLNLPKDRLMAELILKHKDLVMDILEHDSLLQNNEAEELDENERNAAWENYKKENDSTKKQSILPILCGQESD